jgi:hypothetical protein
MPSAKTVSEFIADVLTNDHAGASERWYTEDASVQENQEAPLIGRDLLVAREERLLASVSEVRTELIGGPLIEGDQVAIRWRFTFERVDGARLIMEEVAWQTWQGERICRETFFYDPAQRQFRS